MVIITHKLPDVMRFTDEVTVLRRGRLAGHGATTGLSRGDLTPMMIGEPHAPARPERRGGQRPGGGAVTVGGVPYAATRRQSQALHVRVIPEEPLRNGCVPGMSVVDNLNLRQFDQNEFGNCRPRRGDAQWPHRARGIGGGRGPARDRRACARCGCRYSCCDAGTERPGAAMRIAIPASGAYWLRNTRLPDAPGLADLQIADGIVAAVAPAGAAPDGADLRGGQVWPCFVDVHAHLDKGHIWARAPNPDGTFAGALAAVAADRVNRTEADLRLRMEYGLRCAYAHGTAAICTHLDSQHVNAAACWRAFCAMRNEWAGRIALQAVSLCTLEAYDGDAGRALADQVADAGGILGGVTQLAGPLDAPLPDGFQARLDRLFELANARGLDLDLHVDESGDAGARALHEIARTALLRGFRNRIQCGHCCSLSVQPEAMQRKVIAAVAQAGIAVVTLPMCNMYLQNRVSGRTPRWRGVTLVHELRAAGVPVSVASDNCGDPFYQYGDHDMLEVVREATRILRLDHSPGWSAAAGATPARLMGLDMGRVQPGASADLVLFTARHSHELLARPQTDRIVLRRGRVLDATLPDPALLDGLAPAGTHTEVPTA